MNIHIKSSWNPSFCYPRTKRFPNSCKANALSFFWYCSARFTTCAVMFIVFPVLYSCLNISAKTRPSLESGRPFHDIERCESFKRDRLLAILLFKVGCPILHKLSVCTNTNAASTLCCTKAWQVKNCFSKNVIIKKESYIRSATVVFLVFFCNSWLFSRVNDDHLNILRSTPLFKWKWARNWKVHFLTRNLNNSCFLISKQMIYKFELFLVSYLTTKHLILP